MPIDEDDTNWDHVVPGVMPDGDVEVGYVLKEDAWDKVLQGLTTYQEVVRVAGEEVIDASVGVTTVN